MRQNEELVRFEWINYLKFWVGLQEDEKKKCWKYMEKILILQKE